MDCRTIGIKKHGQSGMTLLELMVASAIGSLISIGVAQLMMYSGRTFSAMANYVSLDRASRFALDTMTKQIRQANRLIASTETVASLEDSDGGSLTFAYDPYARTLTRSKNGRTDTEPLLTECDRFKFAIFQRSPVGGSYEAHPTSTAGTGKLIQMSWICSRQIFGLRVNTESVQSCKIVIRNQ